MKLRLVRNYAIALLDLEPAEIKNKVEAEYERYKEEVEEIQKEATMTPQAYVEYVRSSASVGQSLPSLLGQLTRLVLTSTLSVRFWAR